MLTITRNQFHVFEVSENEAYEHRLVRHAQRFFPEKAAGISDPDLLDQVRQAVAAARGYGLATERDICKYLNLTLALGKGFDSDPALPWARAILLAQDIAGPTLRINRLYLKAIECIDAETPAP